jgi:hypothetical protein
LHPAGLRLVAQSPIRIRELFSPQNGARRLGDRAFLALRGTVSAQQSNRRAKQFAPKKIRSTY